MLLLIISCSYPSAPQYRKMKNEDSPPIYDNDGHNIGGERPWEEQNSY